MPRRMLVKDLAESERRVASGLRLIHELRTRLDRLKQAGVKSASSETLLRNLQESLDLHLVYRSQCQRALDLFDHRDAKAW